MVYDKAMAESFGVMSWSRSLLVAVVLWSCLAAATGLAAWLVDERDRASRMSIDEASLRIPQSFVIVPETKPLPFLQQSIQAISPNDSQLILGEFTLKEPVPYSDVLPQVTSAMVQTQFSNPNQQRTTLHARSLERRSEVEDFGPIQTYTSLLCQVADSPLVWHMIVGLATEDNENYITFTMRFPIPLNLVSQPVLNPLLRNNTRIYQAVARTIRIKES